MSSTPPSSAWLRMFTSCNCDTPTCHLFCVLIIITWHTNNKNTSMLNVLHYSNTPTCYLFYEKIFLFNGSEEYIWTLLLTLIEIWDTNHKNAVVPNVQHSAETGCGDYQSGYTAVHNLGQEIHPDSFRGSNCCFVLSQPTNFILFLQHNVGFHCQKASITSNDSSTGLWWNRRCMSKMQKLRFYPITVEQRAPGTLFPEWNCNGSVAF